MLNLDIAHYQHLKESAIDDDIAALNFRSWDANSEIDRDDVFSLIIPDPKYRNNGSLSGNSQNNLANILYGGGWLYEGFMGVSMKPNCPREFVDKLTGKTKTIKYESVRGCQQLFVPRVSILAAVAIAAKLGVDREFDITHDPNSEDLEFWHWFRASGFPLIVTEGCKKACATISAGYAAIGLNGVWGWGKNDIDMFGNVERDFNSQAIKTLNPDLHGFIIDREVILAFDFDENADTIATVAKASRLFAEKITDISSGISKLKWGGSKGIDDLIVAKGVKNLDRIYKKRMPVITQPVGRPRKPSATPIDRDYQQLATGLGFELSDSGIDGSGIPLSKLVKLKLDLYAVYGSRIEYNLMSHEIELDRSRIEMGRAKDFVVTALNYDATTEDCKIALASIADRHQYHAVRNYLESVKGKADLNFARFIPSSYWGNGDPLQNHLFYLKMIATVARAMSPGCKDDSLLILQGGQGARKSTALLTLAGDGWFTDDLKSLDNKDELAKLSRFWMLELAEVDYLMGKKETELFKRFLSSKEDTYRPPYGYSNITTKRSSAMFATTNKTEFLNDPTGNRRYWVVDVVQKIDIAGIKRDRDLLWASALHAYESGINWYLDESLEVSHESSNDRYQETDIWNDLILSGLPPLIQSKGSIEYVSTQSVVDRILNIPVDRQDKRVSNRVGKILAAVGFEYKPVRIDGRIPKMWVRSLVDARTSSSQNEDEVRDEVQSETYTLSNNNLCTSSTLSIEDSGENNKLNENNKIINNLSGRVDIPPKNKNMRYGGAETSSTTDSSPVPQLKVQEKKDRLEVHPSIYPGDRVKGIHVAKSGIVDRIGRHPTLKKSTAQWARVLMADGAEWWAELDVITKIE